MKITQQQIDSLKSQFLGKRITFKDTKGVKHTGICDFIGYNEFLPTFGFQVTISRCPITNVDYTTIKLADDLRLFKK